MQKFLDRAERRVRPYAVPDLIKYILIGQAIVFVAVMFVNVGVLSWLSLSRALLLKGQIWRVITFLLVPEEFNMLWLLVAYFTWMVGTSLERAWGTGWFNLYYLFGILGAVLACLITGGADASGMTLSLFLAYAVLYPRHQLLLFFVLPIEVRWLALLEAVLWLVSWVMASPLHKVGMLLQLLPFMLFFGPRLWHDLVAWKRRQEWKRRNRRY